MYKEGVFKLAFGSSLIWQVTGGTNFWKDLKDQYVLNNIKTLTNEKQNGGDANILAFKEMK